MTRKMRQAPDDINIIKTTRGTWIALEEVWDGDALIEVRAMRHDEPDLGIVQETERRLMLAKAELAYLNTQLRQAQRRIRELTERERATPRDGRDARDVRAG